MRDDYPERATAGDDLRGEYQPRRYVCPGCGWDGMCRCRPIAPGIVAAVCFVVGLLISFIAGVVMR